MTVGLLKTVIYYQPQNKYENKKKKLKSFKWLEDKLWTVFSIYVRSKDADYMKGIIECYSCGELINWKYECDAGHYIKRSHHATKFDERNVKPQCKRCNKYLDGNQDEFAVHLLQEYGEGILIELNRLKHLEFKFTRDWLEFKIKYYENKLNKM